MRSIWATLLLLIVAAAPVLSQSVLSNADLKVAFAEAERGEFDLMQAAPFAGQAVYPWLQASILRNRLDSVDAKQVRAFLETTADQPVGRWLRDAWLREMADRRDWLGFLSDYRGSENAQLRCLEAEARWQTGHVDEQWVRDVQALWLVGSKSSSACESVFTHLGEHGNLDASLRWQRIDLAIVNGDVALVRQLASGLPESDAALAMSYAAFLDQPSAIPVDWPTTARTRNVVIASLVRMAKKDPAQAMQWLELLSPALSLDDKQRGKVLYDIALWSTASYLPEALARLDAVPATAVDDRLREWRFREAVARGDDASALSAIDQMSPIQHKDARWQYFEARLRERAGQTAAAFDLYRAAATSANFHGWLAADRLRQAYALCPLEPVTDPVIVQRVGDNVGLRRAFALYVIDRPELAVREWAAAIKPLSDDERRIAIRMAVDKGWYDRAVVAMVIAEDDVRHYSLRFPLHHEEDLRQQARINGLDASWVAGQARAESSFMANAISAANARGLMQLLPETGARVAERLGVPWQGDESLFDPATSIQLGTAYLRQMLDRFSGLPYLAIAAFNAGPTPVERWLQARPLLEPDFFIETIPYKETRDYVARVLAFSVVYDWRLFGDAAPLEKRLSGKMSNEPDKRHSFACPSVNAPVVAATNQ